MECIAIHVRFVQVEPTTRCNYTCGFCAGRHMLQHDMPVERFRHFIESVEGLEGLELQGEGEPLLHGDFFTMIGIARERFPELDVSVITNGSMFSAGVVEQIIDFNIRQVYVSVESVQDAVFQRIRGGSLEKVRKGIARLLERRQACGKRYPVVGLAVTLLNCTIPELAQRIPSFYREMGLDGGVNIQTLQTMPQYTRYYDAATTRNTISSRESRQLMQSLRNSDDLRALLTEKNLPTGFYGRLYDSVDSRIYCPWLKHGLYLAAGGEVMPCCYVKDYQVHAMANLDDGLEGVIRARSMMQKDLYRGQVPPACDGCSQAKRIVHNLMLARALALTKPE